MASSDSSKPPIEQVADESVRNAPGGTINSNRLQVEKESTVAMILSGLALLFSVASFVIVVVIATSDHSDYVLHKQYVSDTIAPLRRDDQQMTYWFGQCSVKADALTEVCRPVTMGLVPRRK